MTMPPTGIPFPEFAIADHVGDAKTQYHDLPDAFIAAFFGPRL